MTTKPKNDKPAGLPQMLPVKSSSIKSVGFAGGIAYVEYANGGIYRFPGVMEETIKKVMSAESVGRAFQAEIAMKIKGVRIEG
jgi:hypothetical protein